MERNCWCQISTARHTLQSVLLARGSGKVAIPWSRYSVKETSKLEPFVKQTKFTYWKYANGKHAWELSSNFVAQSARDRKTSRLQQNETFIVRPFLYEYVCILRWSVRIGFVVENVRLRCRIPQFSDHILLTRTCCQCWHATSLTRFMAVDTSGNTKALMNLSFHESCNCSVLNADFCSQTYSRF